MPLTLQQVPTRPTIVAPVHRMHPDADPDWRRVEAVASRFKLPSHRTAVRMYLYSVLRDVVALRTFGDRLLYPGKLRKAIRKGKGLLDEARRIEPKLMDALMADLGAITATGTAAPPRHMPRS